MPTSSPSSPSFKSVRLAVGALFLAGSVAVGGGAGAAVAATPQQTPARTEATTAGALAAYLAANDDHFHTTFSGTDYPDYGLTLDGVFGLEAADAGADQAKDSLAYVGENLSSYIGSDSETYAGATAKTLVAISSYTRGARMFGDTNLVARLRPLENGSGRFKDDSSFGDYSNTFSQSFALIGLTRADAYVSPAAVSYLYRQQCPGGGFRVALGYTPCSSAADADNDATAIALQAILALPTSDAATSRLNRGAQYLKQQQLTDGGLAAAGKTTSNTNTTGIAEPVMQAVGYTGFVKRAKAYLAALQYGCDAPRALRGLVAYDSASKTAGLAGPSDSEPGDNDLRATPAALLGLSGQLYRDVSIARDEGTAPTLGC